MVFDFIFWWFFFWVWGLYCFGWSLCVCVCVDVVVFRCRLIESNDSAVKFKSFNMDNITYIHTIRVVVVVVIIVDVTAIFYWVDNNSQCTVIWSNILMCVCVCGLNVWLGLLSINTFFWRSTDRQQTTEKKNRECWLDGRGQENCERE